MFTTIIFFTIISLIFSNTDASPITGTRKSLFSLKTLEPIKLTSVSDNKSRTVPELVKKGRANSIVIFFTHFGDLSSMELAQQLKYYLPQIQKAKINVIGIGPGTVENAKEFCSLNNFPIDLLHVDETAICYTTLKFSRGFLPNANISPYLKLLPMLAGIGSPGTIPEVLRGYFGDREAPSAWIKESLRLVEQEKFDVLGENYQRPFELATIRLQNMIDVIGNWNKLLPANTNLLTQLGGAYVVNSKGDVLFEHKDQGILKYVDLRKLSTAAGVQLVN